MKKKSILALLIVFLMVLSMTGCQSPAGESTPAPNTGSDEVQPSGDDWDPSKYLIGFSQGWNGVEFCQTMRSEIEETCKKYNIPLVSTDANDSAEKQIADIEDLITRGVDVLLVATYKPEAIGNACQKAMDAGIPVIVLSTAVHGIDSYLLTCDAFDIGVMAAEYLFEKMGGEGQFIHLSGKEGSTVNAERTRGMMSVLEKYPDIEMVASMACNYDRTLSLTTTEDLLKVYPNVTGLYANNDDMALGAIQALEEFGKVCKADGTGDVVVVSEGDGLGSELFDRVADGSLYAQRNPTYGVEGVETAIKLLKGETVEKIVSLPGYPMTPENIDTFR